jgi:isopenicillin-N N-acyltransferase like protein
MPGPAIKRLTVSGSPRERGRQIGEELGDLARETWREVLADLGERAARPLPEAELRALLAERAAFAARVAPDLDEELRGVAEGAGVDYEVAVAINNVNELNSVAAVRGSSTFALPEKHCLSLVVPAAHSATRGVLLAQTWDSPRNAPLPWLLTVEEEAGRSVFLTDPGWLGGAGVNDRGTASVHTGLHMTTYPVGIGYSHIARRIMQAPSAAAALAASTEFASSDGCHYLIGDRTGASDAIVAADQHTVVPVDGWLSTHYHVDDPAFAPMLETDNAKSLHRTGRILDLARAQAERGPINPLQPFELFGDHATDASGAAVCLHQGEMRIAGMIVADAGSQTVWASVGNPCEWNPVSMVTLA